MKPFQKGSLVFIGESKRNAGYFLSTTPKYLFEIFIQTLLNVLPLCCGGITWKVIFITISVYVLLLVQNI